VNKQTGAVTISTDAGGVLMHPDCREVIPLAPEPIEKQDGSEKNDCERNAPNGCCGTSAGNIAPEVIVWRWLASNARTSANCKTRTCTSPGREAGDHPFLFDQVLAAFERTG